MGYVVVDRVLFARLKLHLPANTRKHLMAVYGISETTWCKMRDQKPLKSRTLTRVLARLELAIATSYARCRSRMRRSRDHGFSPGI
jgi:hypothetical protein